MYRIGIVGQSTRKPIYVDSPESNISAGRDDQLSFGGRQFEEHWAHRGDSNFDPDAWMVLHRAIWPNLRKGRIFGNR